MSVSPGLSALPTWLREVAAERGYEHLTPIQSAVLAPELAGRDLRLRSATGSGKTLAVAAALGEALVEAQEAAESATEGAPVPFGPRVLVVAPTRELATQLHRELSALFAGLRCRLALLIGGGSYRYETAALQAGPEVVIATPGRLLDHMQRERVDLGGVGAVALDEADQLLELGFQEDLERILSACPDSRRTLLSSATFAGPVLRLAERHQSDPVVVEGTPAGGAHADIEHIAHVIHRRDLLAAVTNLLLVEGDGRSMVFVAMRAQVADMTECLVERGFAAVGLSGDMSQAERSRALATFRAGRARVMVATDVAARGIDVEGVGLVIHAESPRDTEALIHRSGRTGRAGQRGRSVQLVPPPDLPRVRRLFSRAGLKLPIAPAPSHSDVEAMLSERLAQALTAPDAAASEADAATVQALLQHLDSAELLQRLVAQLRAARPCQPAHIEPVQPPKSRPGPREGANPGHRSDRRDWAPGRSGEGFVQFELTCGSRTGATPQRVMAMVCRRGRVPRQDIGHIDIREGVTCVEVRAERAEAFARAAARPDSRDRSVRIRRLRPFKPRGPAGQRPPRRKPPRPGRSSQG